MLSSPFLNIHSIFLVGYRASGKSTIGIALAKALTALSAGSFENGFFTSNSTDILKPCENEELNCKPYHDAIASDCKDFLYKKWACIDTDISLVASLGQDIATIVASQGWDYFRQQESLILYSCTEPYTVFSTGGGAVLSSENRKFMSNQGYVVYLKVAVKTILKRLENNPQKGQRPALTGESFESEVASTLKFREPLYEEVADIIIDAEDDVNSIVSNILKQYMGNYLK